MRELLSGLAAEALSKLVPLLSDAVRNALVRAVNEVETLAEQTENPWDDELVAVLRAAIKAPEDKPGVEK